MWRRNAQLVVLDVHLALIPQYVILAQKALLKMKTLLA
jgi:hypothetical protein